MKKAAANLDGNPLVERVTAILRSKAGRLDARKIAALYDVPLQRFAVMLGFPLAAVSRSPDAKKYQSALGYFERVARIIPLLEEDLFATWAKTPNTELNGAAPIEWLFAGPEQAQKVVETVEDVLVGQPD